MLGLPRELQRLGIPVQAVKHGSTAAIPPMLEANREGTLAAPTPIGATLSSALLLLLVDKATSGAPTFF